MSSLLSRSRFPRCPARVLPVVLFAFSLLSRFAFPCCPVRVCLSTLGVGLETSLARWCPPTVDGINLVAPSPPKRLQCLLCASISESHPAPLPPNFKVVSQSSARLWDSLQYRFLLRGVPRSYKKTHASHLNINIDIQGGQRGTTLSIHCAEASVEITF